MKFPLYVPSLDSEVVGEYDAAHELAYFSGIPYATVTKRWTHSKPNHTLCNPFDATKYGPRCIQPDDGLVLVTGGISDGRPGDDEFKCLNMNIAVPRERLEQFENGATKKNLPVMVWIHGYNCHTT
jgi:carboxylesterase type B